MHRKEVCIPLRVLAPTTERETDFIAEIPDARAAAANEIRYDSQGLPYSPYRSAT